MLILFALCLVSLPLTTVSQTSPETNSRSTKATSNVIAKPGCRTHCGNLTVPYPFGIGTAVDDDSSSCSINEWFNITCDTSFDPPKAFFQSTGIEIYSISDSEIRISTNVFWKCINESVRSTSYNIIRNPFPFSDKNKFTVIGFGALAVMNGTGWPAGCFAGLSSSIIGRALDGSCSGNGCCQTSVPNGFYYFGPLFTSLGFSSDSPCAFAFLAEEGSFNFDGKGYYNNTMATDFATATRVNVTVVANWVIDVYKTCAEAAECKANSLCKNVGQDNIYGTRGGGYRCSCINGYDGNPYLDSGCQGMVFGFFAILFGITGLYLGIRKRKLIKLREKFFEQNGGFFLKQKINSQGQGNDHAVTIFSIEELQKATDNYAEDRIVGRGGYGIVYKGILPNGVIVAIKKSRLVDGTQAEQFINEVLILTQIIHRNVVKLLGCCLEDEVPLLVYEFISNNTLFHHIHDRSAASDWFSWENRLRVAAEAASALAYLHSAATIPIVHRDVKSMNILLDDSYNTKISDFGASRLIPLDHDQVTTLVQGTLGYLDPEYFHTSQLTDKSDVYSFGVVLAELVTGQKPLCAERSQEDKNLATYFVNAVKERRLFEIVEPRVLREGSLEQLQAVSELVKRCLNLKGEDRPTMKEVAMELEVLRKSNASAWVDQGTREETTSLALEVEQSDLYDIPLIPYSDTYGEFYTAQMKFEAKKPC